MPPGPRGQGPPPRRADPGVPRGAGASRRGRAELRGSLAPGPAQRGLQAALRLPVRRVRPRARQGEHPARAVRAMRERARGGESARRRGGEEDLPPAPPGPRAL